MMMASMATANVAANWLMVAACLMVPTKTTMTMTTTTTREMDFVYVCCRRFCCCTDRLLSSHLCLVRFKWEQRECVRWYTTNVWCIHVYLQVHSHWWLWLWRCSTTVEFRFRRNSMPFAHFHKIQIADQLIFIWLFDIWWLTSKLNFVAIITPNFVNIQY